MEPVFYCPSFLIPAFEDDFIAALQGREVSRPIYKPAVDDGDRTVAELSGTESVLLFFQVTEELLDKGTVVQFLGKLLDDGFVAAVARPGKQISGQCFDLLG